MGIYCKGCVIVRESVKTQAIEAMRIFTGITRLSIPRKDACAPHMTGMQRVNIDGDSCVLQVSRGYGLPAKLYYLIHTFCTYTIYTHITHTLDGEPLRELES